MYYPLTQFTVHSISNDVDLTDMRSDLYDSKGGKKVPSDFLIKQVDFIPFRIKFWQAALLTYSKTLSSVANKSTRLWPTDTFSSFELLKKAFQLFYRINNPNVAIDVLQKQYFTSTRTDQFDSGNRMVMPKARSSNYYIHELHTSNLDLSKDKYRIALINKYVDSKDYLSSLEGRPIRDPEKLEIFDQILDEVSRITDCDIFVMPELALPHYLIPRFTERSAKVGIGTITGVEHQKVENIGFNFVLTILPITVNGDRDAVPVLRLKNHYAPIEEETIWRSSSGNKTMVVPKPSPYRYDLFQWRGLYFSSYYCYELADVFHRSIFLSQVDVIFAPIWNVDTHYYNSLIDSATRDMHNYFVIVNTSQYGFSKISRPQDFINKEKVVVKGGTELGYSFSVLVGDLKVGDLRAFQKMSRAEQEALKSSRKTGKWKATPPDFPTGSVVIRENGGRFYK